MVLHEALKRAGEFIDMEEKKQNRVHKCGDYSSGGIISRYQRMRNSRDDFSNLMTKVNLWKDFNHLLQYRHSETHRMVFPCVIQNVWGVFEMYHSPT